MIHRISLDGDSEGTFSDDGLGLDGLGLYRFHLGRWIRRCGQPRRLLSIGLNPSTATHLDDDNTIRKEKKFARAWGFDYYDKCNLFGLRSTDPRGLIDRLDADGDPDNILEIRRRARAADLVLAAWGGPYSPTKLARTVAARAAHVLTHLMQDGVRLHCLALTKDGIPRHPLYLKDELKPVEWSP